MTRSSTKHLPLLALAAHATLGCKDDLPSRDDVLFAFEAEYPDTEFVHCESGSITCATPPAPGHPNAQFLEVSDCLKSSWAQCEPMKLQLLWDFPPEWTRLSRDIYVLPVGDECRLVVFEVPPESPSTLRRFECDKIGESGPCGTLEPTDCEFVTEQEYDPVLP